MIPTLQIGALGRNFPPLAAPPPSGFDTSMLTGRTYVYGIGVSSVYKGASTTSGLATANDDVVARIDSGTGPATIRTFYGAGYLRYKTNRFGSGLNGIAQLDGGFQALLYNRPSGTASPSGERAISDLWTASEKLVIFAGTLHDAAADSGFVYVNDSIVSDVPGSGYCGLHFYKNGSDAIVQWYNYESSEVILTATVPLGSPFVVACRQSSATLSMSVNNGAWSSIGGSGSTGVMSGLAMAFNSEVPDAIDAAALVTCNSSNSDANIATACTNAGALVGISI